MPYDPGISYSGDKYLFQGVGSLGDEFAQVMDERRKQQTTDAYNDMIMNAAHQRGDVPEDEYNKYLAASHTQKTGIAAGYAANIAMDIKKQLADATTGETAARTRLLNAQTGEVGKSDPMAGQTYYHPTTGAPVGIYGQDGQVQFYPQQATGQEDGPVQTDPLTINGKEIPGIGTNRKTGQYVYYGDSGIIRDDKTGALGTRDTRGNFKPLTSQQISAMDMDPNNPLHQAPAPTPTMWEKIKSAFGGGGSGGSGGSAPAPPAGSSSGKVRVVSPQGVPGFVPANRLQDYLTAGYTQG